MEEFDLAEALGAALVPSSEILSLYIPNKDMDGNDIDTGPWIKEAETLLARMGGGFTRTPAQEGGYLKEEDGEIQREKTVIIYTYILAEPFLKELSNFRKFVHRFGRETRQYAVAVEFKTTGGNSLFFRITEYDVE